MYIKKEISKSSLEFGGVGKIDGLILFINLDKVIKRQGTRDKGGYVVQGIKWRVYSGGYTVEGI